MSGSTQVSTGSVSGLKRPQASSDRLGEHGIEPGTPGYKAICLSTTPRRRRILYSKPLTLKYIQWPLAPHILFILDSCQLLPEIQ